MYLRLINLLPGRKLKQNHGDTTKQEEEQNHGEPVTESRRD